MSLKELKKKKASLHVQLQFNNACVCQKGID